MTVSLELNIQLQVTNPPLGYLLKRNNIIIIIIIITTQTFIAALFITTTIGNDPNPLTGEYRKRNTSEQ